VEVRSVQIPFPSVQGHGPETKRVRVFFARRVVTAAVALSGYSARYSNGDHELRLLTVTADVEVGSEPVDRDSGRFWYVDVIAQLGLRDASGNWDDPYEGEVNCCVFAELSRLPVEIATEVIGVGSQPR
jgi:hypothetical protein